MSEILFLEPVFKEMIWGGNRMREEFGYAIPGEHTGECWAVSAHRNGDCTIADGNWQGKKLSWLWDNHRELFGGLTGSCFPLLTKIIDARDDLSIQVHPDDSYARLHENGSLGKTECWYILDCEEDGEIVIGHHAGTKEELREMIEQNRWDELIRRIPIKKGDLLQINPGCVHAIKGGTMILETQQNSDITYRVYDYGRLSNGQPRELHVEKSIDVIEVPFTQTPVPIPDNNQGRACLIQCSYYMVEKINIMSPVTYDQDKPFEIISVIEGSGTINGIPLAKGAHFILPCGFGTYRLEGAMTLICSSVPAELSGK